MTVMDKTAMNSSEMLLIGSNASDDATFEFAFEWEVLLEYLS